MVTLSSDLMLLLKAEGISLTNLFRFLFLNKCILQSPQASSILSYLLEPQHPFLAISIDLATQELSFSLTLGKEIFFLCPFFINNNFNLYQNRQVNLRGPLLSNKVIIVVNMLDSMELDNINTQRDFQSHFPAVDHSHKHHSLEPDIVMGWRPKNKIMGPIPFNFDAKVNDEVIDELTSFGSKYKERVIFLGTRFQSSFKMHQEMQRSYPFKYEAAMGSNYQHMAAYFRKFHSNFKPKHTRIFKGMNPTIKQGTELTFQSNFQGGNLDSVIKVGENQYDLFIRIDTNTRGHLQWFNFKVKNCGKKKVKFNIVNFQKAKTLYQRGMKPYMYSEYLKQTKELTWFQGGENVQYRKRKLIYDFLEENYEAEQITFFCLSFSYSFEADWQQIQIAYAPSFTYSDMTDMIVKLKRQVYNRDEQDGQQIYLKEQNLIDSLSGLQIPLLTVTDPKIDSKKKKCILISGRIHPGQSCSSFMSKGLLQYICSDCQEAKFLRKNIVFKIVPMINPDGVVVGNFRTSLCGRDLNRTFRMKNQFLIPEVKALKQLVVNLKNQFKSRFIMFFDLHGHSVKKNVFIYGPEHQIWETNYYRTRIFPKLLATKTEMFRYYSCIFRIAEFKKSTARAVVLRNVPHCYTIEASTGFYYCHTEKKDIPYTPQKWMLMGRKIAEALRQYIEVLNQEYLVKEERRQRQISFRTMKNKRIHSKKTAEKSSSNKFQTRLVINNKGKFTEDLMEKGQEQQMFSQKAKGIIELIKEDDKKFKQESQQSGHESDMFSQGGSDSESEDDIPQGQMKLFEDKIFGVMQEYRQKFYKQKQHQHKSFVHPSKKRTLNDEDAKPSRKKSRGLELIASLRKKNQKLDQTLDKAHDVVIWNRMKEEFNDIKNRSVDGPFQSRLFISRDEYQPKSIKCKKRRQIFESEVLKKRQTISQITQLKDYKY